MRMQCDKKLRLLYTERLREPGVPEKRLSMRQGNRERSLIESVGFRQPLTVKSTFQRGDDMTTWHGWLFFSGFYR